MYYRISMKHFKAKNQYVESVKLILIATYLVGQHAQSVCR